jgi:F-type H+-transporting ATPase subunit a
MAEETEATHIEHTEHEAGGGDPMHHIKDSVLFGVDATSGAVVFKPYDEHGHVGKEHIGYAPKSYGGGFFKLEFTKHMGSLAVAATLLFVVALTVSRSVLSSLKAGKAPHGKLANLVEAAICFVRDELVEPAGGHHLAHYTPLFIMYFFLILFCNLLGMVPDVFGLWGTATGNYAITLGMALSVYVLIWILGMYNQGPINFIVHLVPPGTPFWMWPLMFVLEILGPIIKCFVLSVRLFANMIAGHLIIAQLLGLGAISGLLLLLGVPLAVGISVLELLVCVLQAYVFTLLAVGFIGSAIHPEH